MPFRPANLDQLQTRGSETIQDQPVVQTTPDKQGFFTRVSKAIKKRADDYVSGAIDREQTTAEDLLQLGGTVAGGLFDIGGEALVTAGRAVSALTPDIIEDPIKERAKTTLKGILDTPIGQAGLNAINQGVEKYNKFKENNPREADNLEAVLNIGAILPVGRVGKVAAEEVSEIGAKKVGKKAISLEKKAEKGLKEQKESFIRKLVRPEQTKAVKEAQVARTTEKGVGPFKRSIIEPTELERRAEVEVGKIKGISPKNTAQQNYNIIQEANKKKAVQLKKQIAENDVLIPRREMVSALEKAKTSLVESPLIVGDAQKTAQKLISGAEKIIKEHPGKASGLHDARIAYDKWVLTQKPKVFDAKAENAFTIANDEIRTAMNELLDNSLTDVATKASRQEQSALFNAMKTIESKAAKEADTAFGRFFQRTGTALGIKNKAVQIAATTLGIGGLGAASTFAPTVAVLGGLGFLALKGGKLAISPQTKKAISVILKEIERLLKKPDVKNQSALIELKNEANKLISDKE